MDGLEGAQDPPHVLPDVLPQTCLGDWLALVVSDADSIFVDTGEDGSDGHIGLVWHLNLREGNCELTQGYALDRVIVVLMEDEPRVVRIGLDRLGRDQCLRASHV